MYHLICTIAASGRMSLSCNHFNHHPAQIQTTLLLTQLHAIFSIQPFAEQGTQDPAQSSRNILKQLFNENDDERNDEVIAH